MCAVWLCVVLCEEWGKAAGEFVALGRAAGALIDRPPPPSRASGGPHEGTPPAVRALWLLGPGLTFGRTVVVADVAAGDGAVAVVVVDDPQFEAHALDAEHVPQTLRAALPLVPIRPRLA